MLTKALAGKSKCLFVREGSASIVTFSVPMNTVFNKIVLRGRGGYY